jgi:perosamine synthetase
MSAPMSTGEAWRTDTTQVAQVFWRGSFAMAAGVETVRKAARSDRVTVWIPGYFCDEALDPLRRLPVDLRFYPVLEDLSPDWSAISERHAELPSAQILVLVHYFGFPNATNQAKIFCRQHNLVLLEDSAHVLRPAGGIGNGDLSIFSPWKILAVPSGGILVTSQELANHLPSAPLDQRGEKQTIHWLAKRLTQKVLVPFHIPWHRVRKVHQQDLSPERTNNVATTPGNENPTGCNPFDLRLLSVMWQDMSNVIEQRRRNYQNLLIWSKHIVGACPLFDQLPDDVCPYAFPMLVERGSANMVAKLQSQGIPASQWPDLSPEVLAAGGNHQTSIHLFERLLLLPVHQSLTPRQINLVGRKLRQALSSD